MAHIRENPCQPVTKHRLLGPASIHVSTFLVRWKSRSACVNPCNWTPLMLNTAFTDLPRVWILATELLSSSTLHSQIKTLSDNVAVSILVTNPLLNNKGLSLFPRTVYWFFWAYPFFTFWFFCFPLFTFWFCAVDSRCRCQLFSASRIYRFVSSGLVTIETECNTSQHFFYLWSHWMLQKASIQSIQWCTRSSYRQSSFTSCSLNCYKQYSFQQAVVRHLEHVSKGVDNQLCGWLKMQNVKRLTQNGDCRQNKETLSGKHARQQDTVDLHPRLLSAPVSCCWTCGTGSEVRRQQRLARAENQRPQSFHPSRP